MSRASRPLALTEAMWRSVTSSFTPGTTSNSWRASSKRTWVTAAPGIEDRRVRRRLLPSVWPKPGSRGEMAKRCRLPSGSPSGSTVGRWIMSMVWRSQWLLGVQLDDELFTYGDVDVLPHGQVPHGHLRPVGVPLKPGRHGAVERVEVV